MKVRISRISLSAIAGMLTLASAHAVPIQDFVASGGSGSTAYNVEADFTVGGGSVTLVLKNLQQDPISAAQLISGISFSISGLTGNGVLASGSGNIATVNADGTYTPPLNPTSPLPRWHVSGTSGTTVSMTALGGGQPSDLIIGPDSAGGFAGAGTYDQQNSSIGNFQPSILGSAAFVFTLNGVTADSVITGVTFDFGTQPDFSVTGHTRQVPDGGSTMALLGAGLIGLGLVQGRFGKRK